MKPLNEKGFLKGLALACLALVMIFGTAVFAEVGQATRGVKDSNLQPPIKAFLAICNASPIPTCVPIPVDPNGLSVVIQPTAIPTATATFTPTNTYPAGTHTPTNTPTNTPTATPTPQFYAYMRATIIPTPGVYNYTIKLPCGITDQVTLNDKNSIATGFGGGVGVSISLVPMGSNDLTAGCGIGTITNGQTISWNSNSSNLRNCWGEKIYIRAAATATTQPTPIVFDLTTRCYYNQ